MTITFDPIGIIRTPHKTRDETPSQGTMAPESKGKVEVFPEFEAGLKDIETFTHIILLYHLDKAWRGQLGAPRRIG